MLNKGLGFLMATIVGTAALTGCAMMGDGIPPEKLGEYGLIESRIGTRGSNMDTLPASRQGFENTAYISWVNGKSVFPARPTMNVLPGEYEFQVGIGCDNTATCRPGTPYKLNVKAGSRYVLTPSAVLVSDRFVSREEAKETQY